MVSGLSDTPTHDDCLIDTPEAADLQSSLEKRLSELLDQRNDAFHPALAHLDQFGFEVGEKGAVTYTN
ncbi:MAG TPA: hypothetical protein DIU35_03580 [Candidatus Latescibacteria bacterium]|nr:hypothetical protein [Candidatus Latescibacterota bacterium]